MFASLVALDGFHLLSTLLTADLTLKWSGGFMFHPLSHIYAKILFYCVETVANNALNCRCVIVFDRLSKRGIHFEHRFLIDKYSCKMVNTLPSDIFNSSAISRNFNLRSAKTSWCSFLLFSGTTAEFGWPESSPSFVSIRPRLKSAYHLLTVLSDGAESK